jgi:NADH dehydrogenase
VVTLWAAGVAASPLGRMLGFETDRKGCVLVDQYLNPKGHPEIFVCGDLAHVEVNGKLLPGVAQPAMQMGAFAARRIGSLVGREAGSEGRDIRGFSYFDKGDMATIGRKRAIARVVWPFKADWSGLMAWLAWLMVHVFFLIGFRSRIKVFLQWAWTYLTLRDGARLITGSQDLPGWDGQKEER